MSEPVNEPVMDISEIVPSKWKPIVGLVGSFLTLVIPYVVSASTSLPQGWSIGIGVVVAILTGLGIYHAPYKPQGVILAPATPEVVKATQAVIAPAPGTPPPAETPSAASDWKVKPVSPPKYRNPWKP